MKGRKRIPAEPNVAADFPFRTALPRSFLRNLLNLPGDSTEEPRAAVTFGGAGSMKLLIFAARLRVLDQRTKEEPPGAGVRPVPAGAERCLRAN